MTVVLHNLELGSPVWTNLRKFIGLNSRFQVVGCLCKVGSGAGSSWNLHLLLSHYMSRCQDTDASIEIILVELHSTQSTHRSIPRCVHLLSKRICAAFLVCFHGAWYILHVSSQNICFMTHEKLRQKLDHSLGNYCISWYEVIFMPPNSCFSLEIGVLWSMCEYRAPSGKVWEKIPYGVPRDSISMETSKYRHTYMNKQGHRI